MRKNMKQSLTISWLYSEYMSTYGDRGNIMCLAKRCQWRGIEVSIQSEIKNADLIFAGGAQDRQQSLIIGDLLKQKNTLQNMFDNNIPGLFVCGAPQLLGHYYETADRKKLPGLGIFDMVTKSGFGKPRLIGNLVVQTDLGVIVGFENHSGRTYLGSVKPFGTVMKGFGNNGEDKTEGARYNNCLATYSHGPLLPKNPHIADWLIAKALEVKYQKVIPLKSLDNTLEIEAHNFILTNR